MNCRQREDFFVRYFDGLLSETDTIKMRKHLEGCDKCSEEFTSMKQALHGIDHVRLIDPPEGFEKNVLSKVAGAEKTRSRRTALFLALVYNSAIAVSIILLLIFAGNIASSSVISLIRPAGDSSLISMFFEIYQGLSKAVMIFGDMLNLTLKVAGVILEEYYLILLGLVAIILAMHRVLILQPQKAGGKPI